MTSYTLVVVQGDEDVVIIRDDYCKTCAIRKLNILEPVFKIANDEIGAVRTACGGELPRQVRVRCDCPKALGRQEQYPVRKIDIAKEPDTPLKKMYTELLGCCHPDDTEEDATKLSAEINQLYATKNVQGLIRLHKRLVGEKK